MSAVIIILQQLAAAIGAVIIILQQLAAAICAVIVVLQQLAACTRMGDEHRHQPDIA